MATQVNVPSDAQAFVKSCGWSGASIAPLVADASARRYYRVERGPSSAILMDAPPPKEDPRPFLSIAADLRALGFRTPTILGQQPERGFVLLEDFGDVRIKEHLESAPDDERAVYSRAVDLLVDLGREPALDLPKYDMDAYLREVALFPDYYARAQGLAVDADAFAALWRELLEPVIAAQTDPVTVLRDYHAENVMLLDNGELGLLDFQDALAGHPAYDLVSLLQDARRDVPAQLEAEMVRAYIARSNQPDEAAFRSHYAVLGAQRNTKIIGIFTRLFVRDGKPRYLDFLPRMWDLLERDLAHPDLAKLRQWFDAHVPPAVRARPVREAA